MKFLIQHSYNNRNPVLGVLWSWHRIKFICLFENRGHRGPYKPSNHNLYIGIIIFPHIDNPQSTLQILKEILNRIWTSADFPQQWRAATVIPIPKPNKDRTDPLSYRPIALTSCLCKVLERMINTRFIWYLEKYKILDRCQCGFRKHRSTTDHLVSLERYLRDTFAQRQQAVGLLFDLEKAYETTWL